ncbi:hypothetical protein AAH978_02615 [Streptomyces sp. ZYX-F-203]
MTSCTIDMTDPEFVRLDESDKGAIPPRGHAVVAASALGLVIYATFHVVGIGLASPVSR